MKALLGSSSPANDELVAKAPHTVSKTAWGRLRAKTPPGDGKQPLESAVSLRLVRLTPLGYDNRGRYYGPGPTLWSATTAFGQVDYHVRADSRAEAKQLIRGTYPSARFLR